MANLLKKSFLQGQVPLLSFFRSRGKINIQRPRKPHYKRALFEALTVPKYPKPEVVRPCGKNYSKDVEMKKGNPYEVILGREVRNWFEHSQMVGVFHVNPISGEDFFNARVAFHKNGMQLKKYGIAVMNNALQDTKFEVLLELQKSKTFATAYVFSTEHNNIATVMKLIKKIPQMHLLCGIIEDRLLSKNELVEYAKMSDINIARSQLVNVLNMAASQLVQNLESHQSNLVNILDAHVRANEKNKEEASKAKEPEREKS